MNKYNKLKDDIIKIITVLCLMALSFSATVWAAGHYADFMDFSSPSSTVAVSDESAAIDLISCMDLQRELNRRDPNLKLDIDGDCGTLTQAAWDKAMGHQYAKELMEAK